MDGQQDQRRPNFPRMVREQIVHEYLSEHKTCAMLSKEYGVCLRTINKMIRRYKQKNSSNFTDTMKTLIFSISI